MKDKMYFFFSVLQTEQSLHADADQIGGGGATNTTMALMPPRSATDTFPTSQGESTALSEYQISFSVKILDFLDSTKCQTCYLLHCIVNHVTVLVC